MMQPMKTLHALLCLLLAAAAHAADSPYNPAADARQEIRQALAEASTARVPVLLVFGANWCPDCRVLDSALKTGPNAAQFAREFRIVKVDVGRFDRNVDLAESYQVPLKKGIPAVAILSPDNQLLYASRAGELADARSLGESGIFAFLRRVTAPAGARP